MLRRYALLAFLLICIAGVVLWTRHSPAPTPIRIGVLHSLSGTMSASERPLADAVQMAVAELNADGGVLGRPVEVRLADSRSDAEQAAREAERLITAERVSALFACWTSACRAAVRPIVERHHHLLFYPVQYEGMEQSPNILYTGLAPNQQIVPGTHWMLEHFGKRVFLVGSDYRFPRTANLIIRDLVEARGGEVVGEHYLPLGSRDFTDVVAALADARPVAVLNTLNGDSNAAFFAALIAAGLVDQPVMSFSVAEPEMRAWGGGRLTRHYAVWSYFQSVDTPQNRRFVANWRARFGADRPTSDPVEAAYIGVKLWAQAVRDAGSDDPVRVNAALLHQSVGGPSSIEAVDPATRHLWKRMRVGHVLPDGQFEQVFASDYPLRPAPWPSYRSREAWQQMLEGEAP